MHVKRGKCAAMLLAYLQAACYAWAGVNQIDRQEHGNEQLDS